jgi:hypothetical protein
MNYLNANIQCFDNTQYLTSNPLTHFTAHVTCSKTKTGQYKVHAFGIILFLNIRGSQCNQTHNPLSRQEKLNFKIRLTKVSEIPEGQLSYDLADFTLDLSDKSLIHKANFNYIDLIKVLNVRHLIINSTGEYVVKVGLFLALAYWNEWYLTSLFITDREMYSLQYYLYDMLNSSRFAQEMGMFLGDRELPGESIKMAMVVVVTGPIIFLYPFVQKYFVAGITIGSVKG